MSEEKINHNSLIEKVLGYVDSPFKLFAILLMAVFAFVGYFVWQNQAFLLGAYKEQQKLPAIAEDRVEDVAAHLFKNTDAAVVAIFKVNPMFGTRVLHRAYTKEGRQKTHEGLDVGLFTAKPGQGAFSRTDVLAMTRLPVQSGKQVLVLVSKAKPAFAGIDPYNKYVDRNSDDNLVDVS